MNCTLFRIANKYQQLVQNVRPHLELEKKIIEKYRNI